jgi:prephenate dehydratase
MTGVGHSNTAGAAADVASWGDSSKAAIASSLAAEIYGLQLLASDIEDEGHNTTRFLLLQPAGRYHHRQSARYGQGAADDQPVFPGAQRARRPV